MCQDEDLKDLGVPFGPRKKLIGYMKNRNQNVNNFTKSLLLTQKTLDFIFIRI